MENDEKEDRIEKMVKASPMQKTFNKVLWCSCCVAGIGIINVLADFVKGRTVDWKEAVGFIAGGLFFLLAYAVISLFVNRSKCFENLDVKEKDEKKGKLSFWILFAFFVVVFIVCGILD